MGRLCFRITGISDRGSIRSANDDHFAVGPFVEQTAPLSLTIYDESRLFAEYGLICAVADGMGGYQGGAVASRIFLDILVERFYAEKRKGADRDALAESVSQCIHNATAGLQSFLTRHTDLSEAGTTVAGITLHPPDLMTIFHVGDSRVMRACGGYLRTLTIDHTPVGADVASGRMTVAQAADTGVAGRLTRSLGLKGDSTPEMNSKLR